jgi:hypothetical protein
MRMMRVLAFLLLATSISRAQISTNPDQVVQVSNLRFHVARNADATSPLAAALETIFSNPDGCCGKDSSLVDMVAAANPLSLQDVAAKLQGRHVLGDGRSVIIDAEYRAVNPTDGKLPAATNLLTALNNNQPLLLEWNSRLYVVYGAVYTEIVSADENGSRVVLDTIEKLLLFDPVSGKQTAFARITDDWTKVQGTLTATVKPSSS